jgi:NAD(P)-dependent dehydrogenase (short-subunit alcohol dehydrogenase family)
MQNNQSDNPTGSARGLTRRELIKGSFATAASLGAGAITASALSTSVHAQNCAMTVSPVFYPLSGFVPDSHIDLRGKVVVITGASSGNGRAAGTAFAAAGAHVIGTSRNASRVRSLPNFPLLDLDITKPDSIDDFMDRLTRWLHGRKIDIAVNNAGRLVFGNMLPVNMRDPRVSQRYFEQIHLGLETLFFGHVRMTHRLMPLMPTSGYARLMYTVSSAGYNTGGTDVVYPFMQTYMSAKRAYLAYCDSLRSILQASGSNIQVTTVDPMTISTHLADDDKMIYTDIVRPGSMGFTDGGNSLRDQILGVFRQVLGAGLDPSFVGDTYVQLAQTAAPPPNALVGSAIEPYATQGGTGFILQQLLAENAQAALPFSTGF